ncbi:CMT1A duplicated region transcript 1 protein-like [Anneissia japonica]|uniref:CMT1A duplicated region transcript 1 protein-like n=1 Tax=Anneissia japonica TaxID=1529436 RepID=UPI0014256E83|nr:CMT1A duplicated region transcript 1 protein-like [Anneissia japonica]XP_033118489.1 CMT1A duplicated region transcript 1 protein-like [Anneissia japonica]XP_033118490.1 CMT1A duplicated region transcript 1 protein-like [Anneissia japonica]
MRHPPENTSHFEFNLGKAPELRCVHSQITTTCGECASCTLGTKLIQTKEWFQRAGETTRQKYILGLIQRFHSADLLRYVVRLLKPLLCKDYTYARSRTNASIIGDSAEFSTDRALSKSDLDEAMQELWDWFLEAGYWSKANYMMGVLQNCNGDLLHRAGTLARTMLVNEEKLEENQRKNEFLDDVESLASTIYSYDSYNYPENELLSSAKPGYFDPITNPLASEHLEPDHVLVEDYEEDFDQMSLITDSSVDPTLSIMPMSMRATSGVAKRRDFIRDLPVFLAKYILNFLDCMSLAQCRQVSLSWHVVAKEVEGERIVQQELVEDVMLMQGSSAQGGNPVYAKHIKIPVPQLIPDTRDPLPADTPPDNVSYRSEINIDSCYSGIVTDEVEMEERNVYCGGYNVMVLSDQHDFNRVVHYNYGKLTAIGSFDRHVQFLDVATGRPYGPVMTGHAGSVRCVYINESRNFVLSGSYDTSIRCWDLKTGRPIKIFRGHQGTVICLDMFEDFLVSGGKDNAVKVWNFESGKCLRTFKHRYQVLTVAVYGDRVVSGCQGGKVKVWSIEDACLIKRLDGPLGHRGPIQAVKIDEWHIATGGSDGYALVWSAVGNHKRIINSLRHPLAVLCLQITYLRLVTGCEDGKLRIWNMLKSECLRVLRGNSRSDPILSICPCGERLMLNTINNLLILNFEEVKWNYEQVEEKIELLRYKNHYKDAPLRHHSYTYVRAQRSDRAQSANPKVIKHGQIEPVVECISPGTTKGKSLPHSTRGLSANSRRRAEYFQKVVRDVNLTQSLRGSVFHNTQASESRPGSAINKGRATRPPSGAGKWNATERSPSQMSSTKSSGEDSRPTTSLSNSLQVSRSPTGILKSPIIRPLTSFSNNMEPSSLNQLQVEKRIQSAPARVTFRADSHLSYSESKALYRSKLRTKGRKTPQDQLLLTVNSIESSKQNTEVVQNTTHNVKDIFHAPRVVNISNMPKTRSVIRKAFPAKQTDSYRTKDKEWLITNIEQVPADKKVFESIHPKCVQTSIPRVQVIRPNTAEIIRISPSRDNAALRSSSAGPVLRHANNFEKIVPKAAQRPRKYHGYTTSSTADVVPMPMFIGESKPVLKAKPPYLGAPDSRVSDPLAFNSNFKIRTREQTDKYLKFVSGLQKQYEESESLKAEKKQKKLWLKKATCKAVKC